MTDEDVEAIKQAIWKHKLIIIKGQQQMEPIKQWELCCRLDPGAPRSSHELFMKDFHPKGEGQLKRIGVNCIPGAENVHLVGKGYQGEDHYGVKDKTISIAYMRDFQWSPIPDEEFEKGFTRFQGWHLDAPMYCREPALFTTFRVVKLPKGPPVTIRWDDGTGYTMKSPPGMTPFFCCSQLYEEFLTDDEKLLFDNSYVEYQALPFEWARNYEQYPVVWMNPSTGRKAFMVHCGVARRLFLRRSPDEEYKVIDDVNEVRDMLYDVVRRILKPEYILIPPEEDGDLLVWDNCSTMHTRVDYPDSYGTKTCHQAYNNSGQAPVGPVPVHIM
ncbi:putative dioxygenase C576.01c-like protein 6 [Colletotrichum chlorophyti]|uniref:Putative dioxygenase C576.01c-like protein 6 n=1 Tax=Colletotrichum chlorophyti TaxID=708187 RepID=A0A1Q8RX06_9PEZI|nr:putative dioxygenase C576.01c-like protein 6 [Colletotrichum chlorophyti]